MPQDYAASDRNHNELPEGNYQCKVVSAQIKENAQGIHVLHWGLCVVSGKYANRMVTKVQRLEDRTMPYVHADLELLGICPEHLNDIEDQLPFALDAVIDISIKNSVTKEGNAVQYVCFNRLVKRGQRTAQADALDGYTVITGNNSPWNEQ